MSRWLKWVLGIIGTLALAVGAIFAWGEIRYGDDPLIPHQLVTITLPFPASDEATGIRALGEVEDVHPFGHPGIDFQWEHPASLIAVGDGTITSISRAEDEGEPVWYLSLKLGEYLSTYKEIETYTPGLRKGSMVKEGDVLGTPHCIDHVDQNGYTNTGCQVHWEWAYASFVPMLTGKTDRLCPLTYFDTDARRRVDAIWAANVARGNDLPGFPDLCSGEYAGHDGLYPTHPIPTLSVKHGVLVFRVCWMAWVGITIARSPSRPSTTSTTVAWPNSRSFTIRLTSSSS